MNLTTGTGESNELSDIVRRITSFEGFSDDFTLLVIHHADGGNAIGIVPKRSSNEINPFLLQILREITITFPLHVPLGDSFFEVFNVRAIFAFIHLNVLLSSV